MYAASHPVSAGPLLPSTVSHPPLSTPSAHPSPSTSFSNPHPSIPSAHAPEELPSSRPLSRSSTASLSKAQDDLLRQQQQQLQQQPYTLYQNWQQHSVLIL